jgi:NAD(P)-dependent dehydrogenase (short-subunit alcohol dehydrogenase family)
MEMTMRKAIFITGGASGIGRAVAIHFGAKGWFVGLADIDRKGMEQTATMLPAGQSALYDLDVRDGDQWKAALASFWVDGGYRLDVMFNNAGIGKGGPFADVSSADHDLMLDINLKGVVRGAEAAYPYLAKTPGSCLLNTCSAAGLYGAGGLAVYAATKFGVRGLTEALDIEWAPQGIKVRSLMPSFIDTPILDSISSGSNRPPRETLIEAGFEISPVELVAQAAWDAVESKKVHTLVGKTARQLATLARFLPGMIRNRSKRLQDARL